MKKTLLLLPIFWLCHSLSAEIPLEKAIKRGIEKSLVIQNNHLEQARLKLEKQKRESRKWFELNLGGTYLYKSQQMEISLSEIPIGSTTISPEPIVVGAKHNYDLRLSLTQPLYTGKRLSSLAGLKGIELEMEEHTTRLNTIDIATRIKVTYFTHRMLTHRLQSLNAFLDKLRIHRQRLGDFYHEELVDKSDLLETDMRLQEQRLILEETKMRIARERIHFKSLCDTGIEEVSGNYREPLKNPSDIFSDFFNENPFVKLLDARIRHLGMQQKVARADTLPQLGGFAEIHYGRPGIDYFQNEWSLYFQGGVRLDLAIFNWNRNRQNQKILGYAREKTKNQKEDYFREIKNQVNQMLASKKTAEKKLEITRKLIRISGEEAELKAALFLQKQITNKDYLASLAAREGYLFREKALQMEIEIIKVNINKMLGRFSGLGQEEK